MSSFFPQIGSSPVDGNQGTSSLRTISRVSLKDTAIQHICRAIEGGELQAGEILTELGLARKLGVAQPTIREALLELEFIGYVERTPTRKVRVTLLTRRSIEEIYIVRTRLETLAVELVAARPSPQLEACREALQEMESAARNGVSRDFWYADLKFHRALWAASENECVENVLERIVPKLFAFAIIRQSHEDPSQLTDSYELHRLLLDAIAAGDTNTASRLMERSMQRAWLADAQLP
jgi:DNA-binding GntR family transcriptional regulator